MEKYAILNSDQAKKALRDLEEYTENQPQGQSPAGYWVSMAEMESWEEGTVLSIPVTREEMEVLNKGNGDEELKPNEILSIPADMVEPEIANPPPKMKSTGHPDTLKAPDTDKLLR